MKSSSQDYPWGYPSWMDDHQHKTIISPTELELEQRLPSVADVHLISCLGDSLLTGLGVTAHPSKFKHKILSFFGSSRGAMVLKWFCSGEYRQNTCICGGSTKVVSIGRLLQYYSPTIIGLNYKSTMLFSTGARFNFATTGATTSQLCNQTLRLIKKLQKSKYKIVNDQWKMVFIWIGGNDVFTKSTKQLQESYERDILAAIQMLRDQLQKVLVYLLPLPDLSHLQYTLKRPELSKIEYKTMILNDIVKKIVRDYQNDSLFVVKVVGIPMGRIPSASQKDLISSIDNIHPSFMAQQLFAKAIWNNLFLEPAEQLSSLKAVTEASWIQPVPSTLL
jgi:lysophospholipase L1-like esterase